MSKFEVVKYPPPVWRHKQHVAYGLTPAPQTGQIQPRAENFSFAVFDKQAAQIVPGGSPDVISLPQEMHFMVLFPLMVSIVWKVFA